jgi:hypothetical protein
MTDKELVTIMDIAINRSWIWMQEYDPVSGQVVARNQPWANEARHAFIDGFIEGFTARFFEGNHEGS